jgi:predicted nucleic acid-binding protein
VLLDSTFLHDLIRGDDDAVAKLDELERAGVSVAISVLTVYEVGVGLRGESTMAGNRFWMAVDDSETIPLGVREAREAIGIQHELLDRGERIGAVDVLIAATAARTADRCVLTRNVDEFERVGGISVETY